LQKRKLEELKTQVRLAGGGEIKDDEANEKAREEAEQRVKDPLWKFPHDIKYLSVKSCKDKIRISERYQGRILKEKVWDDFGLMHVLGSTAWWQNGVR